MERMELLPGLLSYFDRYESLTGVKVDFKHRGLNTEFCEEVAGAARSILQEALTNVARHAGIKKVGVRINATGKKLSIMVQDKGTGFDTIAMAEKATNGLSGMSERAAAAGGELKISSSPGAGTRVVLELPMSPGKKEKEEESGNNPACG